MAAPAAEPAKALPDGKDGQAAPGSGVDGAAAAAAAAPAEPVSAAAAGKEAKDANKDPNGKEKAPNNEEKKSFMPLRMMPWKKPKKEEADGGGTAAYTQDSEESSDEDADGDGGNGQSRTKERDWRTYLNKFRGGEKKNKDDMLAMEKPRTWEMTMQLNGVVNVLTNRITTFFALSFRPDNPEMHKNHIQPEVLTMFTPSYTLEDNGELRLDNPYTIHNRKRFTLSYKELNKHVLVVDMWRVSWWTFNQYYGTARKSLHTIATREPENSILIKTCIEPEKKKGKKKKKVQAWDVAIFRVTVMFEEVFDFELSCENWNLDLHAENPNYEKWKNFYKCLTFVMPKNHNSIPDRQKGVHSFTSDWRKPDENAFWMTLAKGKRKQFFTFRGTRSNIGNQCFLIYVKATQKPVLEGAPAVMSKIGTALLGLTSVLDIEVFKGTAKMASDVRENFRVGTLNGNVRCRMLSKGYKMAKEDIPGGRPMQSTRGSVVHLQQGRKHHLVVRVFKCEGLAVADVETESSDPYLRVSWDGMITKSFTMNGTTRPVFNTAFYFPVRMFDHKMEEDYKKKQEKNSGGPDAIRESALLYELEEKGPIEISVWDDDETSADFLGQVSIPLSEIMNRRDEVPATLFGTIKNTKKDNEEVNELAKVPEVGEFYKERMVRHVDGTRRQLVGCSIMNNDTPKISFEAFFYPDFPRLKLPDKEKDSQDESVWSKKNKDFQHTNLEFAKEYAQPFPDSLGAFSPKEDKMVRGANLRRFPCLAKDLAYEFTPLMAFIVKIITPDEYTDPPFLLHWLNNITFRDSSKQQKTGLIPEDGWKDPEYLLFRRIGSAQDHAIFLCSVLRGCGKDAYVAKGTVWVPDTKDKEGADSKSVVGHRLVEHVWVLSREANGYVTFWETCTMEMYHMPKRYSSDKESKAKAKAAKKHHATKNSGDEEGDAGDEIALRENLFGDDEVHDVTLTAEDVEALPTIGRMPRAKQKAASKASESKREQMKEKLIKQRELLPTAPKQELLIDKETLVDWLPYDSIDVVFNEQNLWANRQNHHPACIYYDFKDEKAWQPLLKDDQDRKEHPFTPIRKDVTIDPALSQNVIERIRQDLEMEMTQNITLYRFKAGLDTMFDQESKLKDILGLYLDILEDRRKLDVDFCPIFSKPKGEYDDVDKFLVEKLNCKKYNRHQSPFQTQSDYTKDQKKGWEKIIEKCKEFIAKKPLFPVKRGKKFIGFPYHFSTANKEQIREFLMEREDYLKVLLPKRKGGKVSDEEDLTYTVVCKIYPMLGGIQSVWFYMGMQKPKSMDEEDGGQGLFTKAGDVAQKDMGKLQRIQEGLDKTVDAAGKGLVKGGTAAMGAANAAADVTEAAAGATGAAVAGAVAGAGAGAAAIGQGALGAAGLGGLTGGGARK